MADYDSVNHDLRPLPTFAYAEYHDTAHVKMYGKSGGDEGNYCVVEFKTPAISTQMPLDSYNKIVEQMENIEMHRLMYKQTDNTEFHNFIKKEKKTGAYKYQFKLGNYIYTFYYSTSRLFGGFTEDYYIAMLIFLGYPKRNYSRMNPGEELNATCMDCPAYLTEPIVDWLDDDEPYKSTLYKYFFTNVGDVHHIVIAYSVDEVRSPGTCYKPEEPKYFIADLEEDYFKYCIYSSFKWKDMVMQERMNEDRMMSILNSWGSPTYKIQEGDRQSKSGSYRLDNMYVSDVSYYTYNPSKGDGVPSQLQEAFDNKDFDAMWYIDMRSLNTRNTENKYQWTYWHDLLLDSEDGLLNYFIEPSDLDSLMSDPNSTESQQIQESLGTLGTTTMSYTRGDFELISERVPFYEYPEYVEIVTPEQIVTE